MKCVLRRNVCTWLYSNMSSFHLMQEVSSLTILKRLKPVPDAVADDEVFADQLAHVQRAHLDADQLFGEPEFLESTASFCRLQLMSDPQADGGIACVKKACSMLPFDIQVSEKALWRAFAEEGAKRGSYFLEERSTTDTLVARSYGLHFKAGPSHANVLGKQTYRKYVTDDRVMIMWKWVVNPIEVDGTKFCGVRCHETGWIVLRGVNIGSTRTTSTLLQSYSKMTMELQDDITNQELQVGAITNFVVNLHDTDTEVYGKMVSGILVEEDWNLNGWIGLIPMATAFCGDVLFEEALALFADLNACDTKGGNAADLNAGGTKVGSDADELQPAKPKKKRIRRQKLELDYLRQLVGKLEQQMAELKERQRAPREEIIKAEAGAASIWKGIAERQQKERARAEEKNRRLRVSLEGQLKLASKLERLLRKRPREDEVAEVAEAAGAADCKRHKPVLETVMRPTEDEIFADQLAHLERAHLAIDELFGGPEFVDQSASFCDLHVMEEPNSDTGVAFVTKAKSLLPFDVHVTEKAFWRAFAEEGCKNTSYYQNERIATESLVARSYSLNFDAGSFKTSVRGKQTYRKYVDEDYVVIMWKSRTEPVKINGTKLSGLHCTQIGWIVLRGVDLASFESHTGTSGAMMSTSLQSYCKMTVELDDDITDQELQVGALTDFVVKSHDAIKDVCGKMIHEVLVEEDWNMNGWLNNIVL
ncbi:unnamed protein product [Phytophthora fragariaefolia]|uniref:Unnamed protein product n=1 Tax=Phytophthora fragariaefolia TaxID=1490495 RepID=A0A9W6Y924_9STRA|nr:unnamed protein product [Phytophthora fragariaefolia]